MGLSELIHFSHNTSDQIYQWFGEHCKTSKDDIAYYSHVIRYVPRVDFKGIHSISELNEMMLSDALALDLFNREKEQNNEAILTVNPLSHEVYGTVAIAKILGLDHASMYIECSHRSENPEGETFTLIFSEGQVSPWSTWRMNEPSNRRKVTILNSNAGFDPQTFQETPLLQTISEMREYMPGNGEKMKMETVYDRSRGSFVLANITRKLVVTDEGSIISFT
jgi:hypothetical protein